MRLEYILKRIQCNIFFFSVINESLILLPHYSHYGVNNIFVLPNTRFVTAFENYQRSEN